MENQLLFLFVLVTNAVVLVTSQSDPRCPGPNEHMEECPSSCRPEACPTKDELPKPCTETKTCKPACVCHNYHRRSPNGTCISHELCPPIDCSARPHEEFHPCPPACPIDDCSEASELGLCRIPQRVGSPLECDPRCRCTTGYWRKRGICVPYKECS